MFFFNISLASLAVVASLTLASAAPNNGRESSQCYTKLAKTKGPCPMKWYTKTKPCTTVSKVIEKHTYTPRDVTIKKTVVTTIKTTPKASKATSTYTQTITGTTTTTLVDTSTSVSSVTTASTSIVPTSERFLPIQSTLPDSSYDGAAGPLLKRGEPGSLAQRGLQLEGRGSKVVQPLDQSSKKYPKQVDCYKYKPAGQCAVKKTTKKVTYNARPKTTTIKVTSTCTKTVLPYAKTTVSTTTSTQLTETSRSTSLTTSTSYSYTTTLTSYAACATANAASRVGAFAIDDLRFVTPSDALPEGEDSLFVEGITTTYECCVAAITYPDGNSQIYFLDLQTVPEGVEGDGEVRAPMCYVLFADTCPAEQQTVLYSAGARRMQNVDLAVIGNANCGMWQAPVPGDGDVEGTPDE